MMIRKFSPIRILTIVCGEPLFHDAKRDVIINPTVIFEVLSQSTEVFDRGNKFFQFRTHNETLQDYILVSQYNPFIDHYTLQANGIWGLTSLFGLDGVLDLPTLNCQVKMTEIYDRIVFPPEPEPIDGEIQPRR